MYECQGISVATQNLGLPVCRFSCQMEIIWDPVDVNSKGTF